MPVLAWVPSGRGSVLPAHASSPCSFRKSKNPTPPSLGFRKIPQRLRGIAKGAPSLGSHALAIPFFGGSVQTYGPNIALRCDASASSEDANNPPNEPGYAVDGNRDRKYAFHTRTETNPWWQVDLKRAMKTDYESR